MKRTNLLAILMAFVFCGLYSCSTDLLEEKGNPATRAVTVDFSEFYSNLQQFVAAYPDQADLTASEKEEREKYIFSGGFGTWYATSSFVKPDIYNSVYLAWKTDRLLNPSTRSVADEEESLQYLETLLTTTYTVDYASKILPGVLTLKNIPEETEEPIDTDVEEEEASMYGQYVGLTASYSDILNVLKEDLGALYYSTLLTDALMMELLLPRVTAITGGTINESNAREKMQNSNAIMAAAFDSFSPFTIDSGISYLKILYSQSANELSVLGLYMSKLSRLENTELRRAFTYNFLDQFGLYTGVLTTSQYMRISAAIATANHALEHWCHGNDTVYMVANPSTLLFTSGNVQKVKIQSNTEWWIVNRVQWLNVDRNNGSGNGILNVTAEANTTGDNRSGRFQLGYVIDDYTDGTLYIDVTQEPGPPIYFGLNNYTLNFHADDLNGVLEITSNTHWRVKSAPDFIYGYTPSGSGDYTFQFSVEPCYGSGNEARVGELIFGYDDNGIEKTATVWINQAPIVITYFETIDIPGFDYRGGYATMNIRTNAQWEISFLSAWMSVTSIVSSVDDDISVITLYASSFDEYYAMREGGITFRWLDTANNIWKTETVQVTQDGRM